MLPQQPTGLVFVLLGDDLPPLIAQQCHKEPTRRLPNPSRCPSPSSRPGRLRGVCSSSKTTSTSE